MKNNRIILVSVGLVYKEPKSKRAGNKPSWFIVRGTDEDDWELPRTTVRRGESSVRAVIRQMSEQGAMRAKVLEEVGRAGGSTSVGGRIVQQRYLYYLMVAKGDNEVLGFTQYDWLEYEKVKRRLKSKRDQSMLAKAKKLARELKKIREDRGEEDFPEEEIVVDGGVA